MPNFFCKSFGILFLLLGITAFSRIQECYRINDYTQLGWIELTGLSLAFFELGIWLLRIKTGKQQHLITIILRTIIGLSALGGLGSTYYYQNNKLAAHLAVHNVLLLLLSFIIIWIFKKRKSTKFKNPKARFYVQEKLQRNLQPIFKKIT